MVLKIAGPISWAVKGTPGLAPLSPGCQLQHRPSAPLPCAALAVWVEPGHRALFKAC